MKRVAHGVKESTMEHAGHPATQRTLARRLASEALGSAFLLVAIVGSGIAGDRLSSGDAGHALLPHALAVGAALVALITALGPISAHFNPAVSVAEAWCGRLTWRDCIAYTGAQVAGALLGVVLTHGMFSEPLMALSAHERSGSALALSEAVATFGLVVIIAAIGRHQRGSVAVAVGAYVAGAIWFTASAAFANPAVTLARAFSDTFVGIRLVDVPAFVGAELLAGVAGAWLVSWLVPAFIPAAKEVTPRELAPREADA